MTRRRAATIDKLQEMVDLLVDNQADGLTVDDFMSEMDLSYPTVRQLIRKLREALRNQPYNLVADQVIPGQRWRYRLVSDLKEARWWVNNRLRDTRERLITECWVLESVVRDLDHRTAEWRKADVLLVHHRRALEDLERIDSQAS